MKKLSSYISTLGLLLVSSAALSSCGDEFERPPIIAPESEWVGTENTTIAELKEMFWQDSKNYATQAGKTEDGENIIVKARIISTDANSTLYQYLYVQDETDAMCIAARQEKSSVKLASQYGYGQEVYINISDLYVGRYSGLFQVGGLSDTGGTTFLQNDVLLEHVQANGLGNPEKIDMWNVTIPELKAALTQKEDLMQYMAHAVRIENVHFTSPGTKFVPTEGTDSNVGFADEDGNSMIIRMNRYCTFGSEKIPAGTGTITGILGYFNNDWQLVINSIEDLQGFEAAPVDPDEDNKETVYEESFSTSLGGFNIENTKLGQGLSKVWSFDSQYSCSKASCFAGGTNIECESWMISPVIDLSDYKSASFSLEQAFSKHFGATDADAKAAVEKVCTIWARTDGGEWEQITGYTYPAQPWSFNFGATGDIALTKYEGKKVQIGFKYFLATTSTTGAGTWEIKNFKVSAVKK